MTRCRLPIIAAVLPAALLLLTTGCSPVADELGWELTGTWANAAYDGGPVPPWAEVEFGGGEATWYLNVGDPAGTLVQYNVAASGVEPGLRWFRVLWEEGITTTRFLFEISDGGNTLEASWSSVDYPADIDPLAAEYGTWARQ